jgi:hypothetical protein
MPQTECDYDKFNICLIYTILNMSKTLSRQIDGLIVSCAIGMGCDKAELMRLASEYGNKHHSLYRLSDANLRSLETKEERTMALGLEDKVNDVIIQQTRVYSELGSHGIIFKTRKHKPRTPSPRAKTPSPRAKTPSPRAKTPSPKKASPKACSPKTRRSNCAIMGGTKRRHN